MSARVVVVGSANRDLLAFVERLPRPGETVIGAEVSQSTGGKGANQAAAACRAGGVATALVARVGDDDAGSAVRADLEAVGLDTTGLSTVPGTTGMAMVWVEGSGENSIVVSSGANAWSEPLSPVQQELVRRAEVVAMQLEIPVTFVEEILAHVSPTCAVVLNAAPACQLPDAVWERLDVLVVNGTEAVQMATTLDPQAGSTSLDSAVALLTSRVPSVVVTLGAQGALMARRDGSPRLVGAPAVTAVDSTGAGDTFCGVLAARIAAGDPIESAVPFAVVAASLSVERPGALPSIPTAAEVSARRGSLEVLS